jgi:hypothetical protein
MGTPGARVSTTRSAPAGVVWLLVVAAVESLPAGAAWLRVVVSSRAAAVV